MLLLVITPILNYVTGPECCSKAPILNPNYGAGHVEKLGGLDTYVTGSSNSNLAILMVSEVFDKVAAAGYYVVVPDFLHGDPFTSENANRPLPIWLKDHQPVVVELAKSRLIQAAVLLHPSFITLDDIKVSHGWTIRYNIEDAMAVKAADESHRILLEWFAKHVK
ncbi:hypothetical protein TSUD_196470 [Trifolium subterraneum]|nr:hypothetical protein TSUD_196470 [Trifolium subterraneum]